MENYIMIASFFVLNYFLVEYPDWFFNYGIHKERTRKETNTYLNIILTSESLATTVKKKTISTLMKETDTP